MESFQKTERLQSDDAGIARAGALLRAGRLVALPTETVYGLAADATQDRAVAAVYEAKGRPSFNPLIVHVADLDTAQTIGRLDATALALAQAFWPGPLTLVVPVIDGAVSPLVTAGGINVALRVPAHPLARQVIAAAGVPLAAPSANPSGRISPTTADHVAQGLTGRIAAILEGGASQVGLESTIIATDPLRLLRAGGLPIDAVEACVAQTAQRDTHPATIAAPGQLASHYAPDAMMRLNVTTPASGEFMIGFAEIAGDTNLSPTGDLTEAAAHLFAALHAANASGRPIAVAPVPRVGLGLAINDRLERAAAPRP